MVVVVVVVVEVVLVWDMDIILKEALVVVMVK